MNLTTEFENELLFDDAGAIKCRTGKQHLMNTLPNMVNDCTNHTESYDADELNTPKTAGAAI